MFVWQEYNRFPTECSNPTGNLENSMKQSHAQVDEKLSELQKQDRENVQRLAALEVRIGQQDRKIAELLEENERLRRVTASQVGVGDVPPSVCGGID